MCACRSRRILHSDTQRRIRGRLCRGGKARDKTNCYDPQALCSRSHVPRSLHTWTPLVKLQPIDEYGKPILSRRLKWPRKTSRVAQPCQIPERPRGRTSRSKRFEELKRLDPLRIWQFGEKRFQRTENADENLEEFAVNTLEFLQQVKDNSSAKVALFEHNVKEIFEHCCANHYGTFLCKMFEECGPQKLNLRLCGGTFECIFRVKSTQNRS